jgi:PhoH-like ATPase
MSKKVYVLDTNVLLSDPSAIFSYKKSDIVIPLKVLEEVDKHKKRQDGVGAHSRQTIRNLDSLREKGSLADGVKLGKNLGYIYVCQANREHLPSNLEWSDPDNQIICTALTVEKIPNGSSVVLVSQDINVRVKCDGIGLKTEDYVLSQIVDSPDDIYTGTTEFYVEDSVIDSFYNNEQVYLSKEQITLFANQFVTLISLSNQSKTALAKFKSYNLPLVKIKSFKDGLWGLKPRNREQQLAIDLLMDDSIKVVTMLGKAGCGKTVLAIAAGLQQVLESDAKYKKFIVARPVQPMGRDIGFLPGTVEEKILPWLAPIQDNLEALLNNDKEHLRQLIDDGTIELEALTYIRGRSIANAYILIDESQNLSVHEVKTILTRVGENTKIILTGDVRQVDVPYLDSSTNGLTHAAEKFKPHDIAGHIILQKGERSAVATLSSEIL